MKRNEQGALWKVDVYNQPGMFHGLSYHLCHGHHNASATMQQIFTRIAKDLGVAMVSFDQEIGGHQPPCYDRTHPHPPGYGPWMWEGFRDTMQAIRTDVGSSTELALSLEQ